MFIKHTQTATPEIMIDRREFWRQKNIVLRLEGSEPTRAMLDMQERHIMGEITYEDYVAWEALAQNTPHPPHPLK